MVKYRPLLHTKDHLATRRCLLALNSQNAHAAGRCVRKFEQSSAHFLGFRLKYVGGKFPSHGIEQLHFSIIRQVSVQDYRNALTGSLQLLASNIGSM
jgi:hypothetical protein